MTIRAKDLETHDATRPANPTWGLDFSLSIALVLLCILLTGVAVGMIGWLFFPATDMVPPPYPLIALGGAAAACSRVDVVLPGARVYSRVVLAGAALAGTGVGVGLFQAFGASEAEIAPVTAQGFLIEAMATLVPYVGGIAVCFATLRFSRRFFADLFEN